MSEWKHFLEPRPEVHFLQTGEWGELKSDFGWDVVRVIVGEWGAQVLFRKLPFGITFGYIPKAARAKQATESDPFPGPGGDKFWSEIDAICRRKRAAFLKIEPDAWEGDSKDGVARAAEIYSNGDAFRLAQQNIQPRRTIIMDLRGSEEALLSRMKPKCRYNVRLAAKKGVSIQPWRDLAGFHGMMQVTGRRDGFAVHSATYMRRAFELFQAAGKGELLLAKHEGKPLAALMVIAQGHRAWYLYGASVEADRELMPNYLLQWEAMRWARTQGCEEYDLWGVPDESESTLEANFEKRQDGLWGVYRFKRGFGGTVRRAIRAWDRVYQQIIYTLYRWQAGPQGSP